MFGLREKFRRSRQSGFGQGTNLTTNPKNGGQRSRNVIRVGYKYGSNWSSDWNSNKSIVSLGHPVEFEVASRSKRYLICMLITVSSLFLLFIIAAIISYAINVLTIKFPPWRTTQHPYPFISPTSLPNFTHQPYLPLFPTPFPPHKPYVITTLPIPTDLLERRTFLCLMFLLNQANEAFLDPNRFEYRQTSQMIQNAIDSQLKQTPLKPYLENVYVWYLSNSGFHLAVEFSIALLLPTNTNIGLTSVRNVLISILPAIEDHLSGAHIDRNSISVQYLYG